MKLRELLNRLHEVELDKPVEVVFVDIYGHYDVIDVNRPANRDCLQLVLSPSNFYKQALKDDGLYQGESSKVVPNAKEPITPK